MLLLEGNERCNADRIIDRLYESRRRLEGVPSERPDPAPQQSLIPTTATRYLDWDFQAE
jgi:hypothetical protein